MAHLCWSASNPPLLLPGRSLLSCRHCCCCQGCCYYAGAIDAATGAVAAVLVPLSLVPGLTYLYQPQPGPGTSKRRGCSQQTPPTSPGCSVKRGAPSVVDSADRGLKISSGGSCCGESSSIRYRATEIDQSRPRLPLNHASSWALRVVVRASATLRTARVLESLGAGWSQNLHT